MWVTLSTIVGLFMAVTMIIIRSRASRKPATVKKIILPPFFMSTGAFMFIFPVFQVSWSQVIEALSVGAFFSLLLISTSRFEVQNRQIFLIPSKAFIFILGGLLAIRVGLKLVYSQTVPFGQISGMFFLLAFGMIACWRVVMLLKYMKVKKELDSSIAA